MLTDVSAVNSERQQILAGFTQLFESLSRINQTRPQTSAKREKNQSVADVQLGLTINVGGPLL